MAEISSGINDQASRNHGNNIENKDFEFLKMERTLMNVVVFDNIIRHLKYEDIRKCRLVCQRWNEVFETVFWKLSRFTIKNDPDSGYYLTKDEAYEEETKKLIQDFNSTFPFQELPPNAVVFEGVVKISLLDYFWKERGAQLTNVCFRNVFEYSHKCINIIPYLTHNLTTLHIKESPNIMISLEMLPNIENLCVNYSQIVLNGKIAPKELTMREGNSVIYNGVLLDCQNISHQKILINDFVDFSNIKKLCLRGNIWKLDIGRDAPHLDNFEIDGVELVGFTNSQWTTNRLNFRNNIYIGVKMELKLFSLANNHIVDLRSLPHSIEKMSISNCVRLLAPQYFVCPKLTYMSFLVKNNVNFPVLNFKNCASLVDVQLKYRDENPDIDLRQIILPNCVKRVKLTHFDITPRADSPHWELDTLILCKCSLSFAENLLKHVRPVKLVLEFSTMTPEKEISILNLWNNSNAEILVFGSHYSNMTKNSDELLKNVDKAGSHFLFKRDNGNGKAISRSQFRSLCVLNRHELDLETIS